MCTTYLGHFEKNRSILVPVSLILKRRPFFRVSMATVVTRVTLLNNLMAHHLAPTFYLLIIKDSFIGQLGIPEGRSEP